MTMAESQPDLPKTDDVQIEVLTLVNELTQKILLRKPENINQFCAEYLAERLDTREAKIRKEERRAKRRSRKKKKAAKENDDLKSKSTDINSKAILQAVSSGMQDQDPLREQISLPEAGARGPAVIPPITDLKAFHQEPEVTDLTGHEDAVTDCCIFSCYLLTSSLDKTVRLWNIDTGEMLVTLDHEKPIHTFVLVPNKDKCVIFAAGDDGKLVAWKLKLGGDKIKAKRTNMMPCHQPNPIRAMACSADGKLMATGCCFYMHQISNDCACEISIRGTLKLWDLPDFVDWALHPSTHHGDIEYTAIKTMKQLVINNNTHMKRQTSSYLCSSRGELHYGIRSLAFSADSKLVAVGFGKPDNAVTRDVHLTVICDTEELTTLWVQELQEYQSTGLQFSTIGAGTSQSPYELFISTQRSLSKVSITLSSDTDQRLWMKQSWNSKFESDHMGTCVSPNGRLVSSTVGGVLHLTDAATGSLINRIRGHEKPVNQLAIAKDSMVICTASEDSEAKLWRFAATKNDIGSLPHHEEVVAKAVLPPITDLHGPDIVREATLLNTLKGKI